MEKAMQIVEVKKSFRARVERRLNKHGKRQQFLKGLHISRQALYQFLEFGSVRYKTLEQIVKKIEGDDAVIENHIETR